VNFAELVRVIVEREFGEIDCFRLDYVEVDGDTVQVTVTVRKPLVSDEVSMRLEME
jgi:hypothetical protein